MMIFSFFLSLFFILIYLNFNKYIFDKFFNIVFFTYVKDNFSNKESKNLYIITQFFFGLLMVYTLSNLLFILNFNIDVLILVLISLLSVYIIIHQKKTLKIYYKIKKKIKILNYLKQYFSIRDFKYYKILILFILLF